jgi:hypothetical protein
MGGHSLKAMQLAAAITQHFNRSISIREIFNYPTISLIRVALQNAGELTEIIKQENQSTYEASTAQKRLWSLTQLDKNATNFNVPLAFRLTGSLDIACLERTLLEIGNHIYRG